VTLQTDRYFMEATLFPVDRMPRYFHNRFCSRVLVALSMESVNEERICVKFSSKVGKTAAEIHTTCLEPYAHDAWSKTTTNLFVQTSKNGRTSTDDDERSGRSSTSSFEYLIVQVKIIIGGNGRLTVREVSEDVAILIG
jgi:hypothetical protein